MPRIEPEEFQARVARCAELLDRDRIDCLLLLPGTSLRYFTGLVFARERYRLLACLIDRAGRLTILGPAFEHDKLASAGLAAEVLTWTDVEDQFARLADVVASRHGPAARVALEPTVNYQHVIELGRVLPRAELADGRDATWGLRAIKSPAEIECLRAAVELTGQRMARVPSWLEEGMTERDLARAFGPGAMVQFGETTSRPNAVAGERELTPGDPIVIDAGDRVEGYRSDLTRTFFYGEPSARSLQVYRIVAEAERAAIDATRPGGPASAVDLAARSVIEAAGFGECFVHRGGHGIGLDFHEPPICVAGGADLLLPGMVLTAEPGIYIPGDFGVRLEDDMLITEQGCELLSSTDHLRSSTSMR